jgi:chromosome segregation ATPase
LLSHLKECAFYSNKDLEDIERNLKHYRETMSENKDRLDPHLVTLLEARLDMCQNSLSELKGILANLTPDLAPTYEKLVSILRTLSACNVRTKFPKEEVRGYQAQLKKIQQQMQEDIEHPETLDEEFARKLHTSAERAAADPKRLVTDLLTRCILWVELIEQQ